MPLIIIADFRSKLTVIRNSDHHPTDMVFLNIFWHQYILSTIVQLLRFPPSLLFAFLGHIVCTSDGISFLLRKMSHFWQRSHCGNVTDLVPHSRFFTQKIVDFRPYFRPFEAQGGSFTGPFHTQWQMSCSCLKSGLIALLSFAIISMASQASTAAKKLKTKGGSKKKHFLDWFKWLKLGNTSATHPNSSGVSITLTSSNQDPGPVNNARNAEPTALSEYGWAMSVLSTTIQPLSSRRKWHLASGYILPWIPTHRSSRLNLPSRPYCPIMFN